MILLIGFQRWSQKHNLRALGIQKNTEANGRVFEDTPSRGQRQEWSRPRPITKDTIFLDYGRQIFHHFKVQKSLRYCILLRF